MRKLLQKLKQYIFSIVTVSLIGLLLFLLLYERIVVVIPPGHAGVLYRLFYGGTVTTKVYDEGIKYLWPWDKMYVYNARVQEDAHKFDVLTKNGLTVHLSVSIRYRPEYKLIGVLHKEVGEDYVTIVVIPEIENVLRVLIGRLNAEEIYTTKHSLIEKAISGAIEQIAQRYVQVDNVIIKAIQLPDSVQGSIQKKIEQKHIADAFVFKIEREKREKERKRIEAEGLERFNKALSPQILHYLGIQATLTLSESNNSKVVIVGGGGKDGGFPIIGNMPLASFADEKNMNVSDDAAETEDNAPANLAIPLKTHGAQEQIVEAE